MFPATSLPRVIADFQLPISDWRSSAEDRFYAYKDAFAERPIGTRQLAIGNVMELLAGLEPAASTYDHPSAAAALGAPVSKCRAHPFELQEQGHCRFPIVDCRFEFGVKNQLAIANRQLAMTLVGEDRIELSPRVPRTRMLRYTTPRRKVKRKKFKGKSVNCEI